ncbi:MAG: branched-chain amino acid aminotransferase [Gammaproteobacteria bacterium]|jgi:branched-chain amino acid aminotransferase
MNKNSARTVYVNGEFIPEDEATISIRDMGFIYGDGVFDTARTFNGKLFRLEEHIDRLFESLTYTRIDPGLSKQEFITATQRVVDENQSKLRPGEDYWVTQRVSTGLQYLDGETNAYDGSTVVIDCVPLPLRARANFFTRGIPVAIAKRPKIAPAALSPNAKTCNYLNMMLAQRELNDSHPGAWALMLDPHGNIAEGAGCNLFTVKDGVVYTPTTEFILSGISRSVVIELCKELGIEVRETTLTVESALAAGEAFFTSTSLCVCPLASLNGQPYAASPGPVTERITRAFAELVDFDFVAQYRQFAGGDASTTGL